MRFLCWGLVGLLLSAAAPIGHAQPLPSSARVAVLGTSSPGTAPGASQHFQGTLPSRTRLDTIPPHALPRDRWLAPDKAKHAGASFFLALGGQYVFENKAGLRRDPALALSLGTGAAVGLGKEFYDGKRGPPHDFSAKDLVADGVGLLLATGVILL